MRKFVFYLVLTALVSGCATMRRGSTESMMFVTAPTGALVTLSTGESCITPCELEVDRSDELNFTISKSGYKKLRSLTKKDAAGDKHAEGGDHEQAVAQWVGAAR